MRGLLSETVNHKFSAEGIALWVPTLRAPDICDLVRLLTISDIFAALIEFRSYRTAMSRPDAYKILCGMNGKLEPALVKAFQRVALDGTKPSFQA